MKAWQAFAISIVSGALALGIYVARNRVEDTKPRPVGQVTPVPESDGWVDLLDAEHASFWRNVTDQLDIFEIADGMLHIYGKTITPLRYAGYTGERFGDFDLHLEFKVAPGANSGVFIRKQPGDDTLRGFEVQVLDDHGQQPTRHTSGAMYDIMTPMYNMSKPAGEWNSYDISTRGQVVAIYMNGWLVGYTDLGMMKTPLGKFSFPFAELPLEGTLALQDHGGEVWYRNIRIRPHTQTAKAALTAPAPPAAPAADAPASEEEGGAATNVEAPAEEEATE
ncbi:MAG: DUF1080 domain-containing protein [Candidatus Hydrogenedens sp.]|nr:DUF1080 domain-containing protein [Candidatus Hydrogenedens sp.]